MTLLSDALESFLFGCRLRGLSERTLFNYTVNVKKFIGLFPDFSVEDLTKKDVQTYIISLSQRPLSKNTIAAYLRDLRVYLRYCDKEYQTNLASAIVFPRTSRRLVTIYSIDEVRHLYNSIPENALKERNALILSLTLDCGLRRQEVCELKIADIDFTRRIMKVTGKGSKDRFVPFGRMTEKQLRSYLASRSTISHKVLLLDRWNRPINLNTVKLFFQKLKKSSGLDVSAHKLRHNFATNFLVHQILTTGSTDLLQLQIILGHADSDTTAIYLHLAKEFIALASNFSFLDSNF